jgi:hypothetical protein
MVETDIEVYSENKENTSSYVTASCRCGGTHCGGGGGGGSCQCGGGSCSGSGG